MRGRLEAPRSRAGCGLWMAGISVVLVLVCRFLGVLEPAELAFYDAARRRAAAHSDAEAPIHLLLIDEASIARYGHPLRDELLVRMLDAVLAAGPRAVGIDLYRDQPVPPSLAGGPAVDTPAYAELGARVRADPRVVLTMKLAQPGSPGTPQPRFLDGAARVGFSDLPVDPDGRVRRGLLYLWQDDTAYVAFAMQLAQRFLAVEGIRPGEDHEDEERIRIGPTVVPPLTPRFGPYAGIDAGGYQFLLDYAMGERGFAASRVADVLEGSADLGALEGRVVLIGTDAVSVKDAFRTPISGQGDARPTLSGVAVHAHAIDQLIRFGRGVSRPLRSAGAPLLVAVVLLFAWLGAALGVSNRSMGLQLAGLAGLTALLLGAGALCFEQGFWLPTVPGIAVLLLSAVSTSAVVSVWERAQRAEVSSLFSRFQGPKVADEIWRRRAEFMGDDGRPASRHVTLTALMSDLEGYTAASEKMAPQELMRWVNEYMNTMAELVERHGGVVDDYAGDGIKANFGFPVPAACEAEIDAEALAAVRCALAMGERMEALNADWARRGLPTGRCRVGVFTGPAVVGCIGGDRSLKFTSVGDTVNIAARLEGFAKDAFTQEPGGAAWRVLIGEDTRRRIGDAFEVVDLGAHALKGKDQPVPIYRVMAEAARASASVDG